RLCMAALVLIEARISSIYFIVVSPFGLSNGSHCSCIARAKAPVRSPRFETKRATYFRRRPPAFPGRPLSASLPVLYSSCTTKSITFCEQSRISASHTSFTSPRQYFSFYLHGKVFAHRTHSYWQNDL